MIILSATTDTVQVILAGAPATNQLPCVTAWRDITTAAYTPGRTVQNTNSGTAVDVVPAPAGSTQRVVDFINVYNADTVAQMVTVRYNLNGTFFKIVCPTLQPGASLTYTSEAGWNAQTVSGGSALTDPTLAGYMDIANSADPAAPSAGVTRFYAKTIAGRSVPKWVGPSGLNSPIQAALYGNNVVMYMPNTSTTAGINLGAPWAVGTTVAHPQPTAGAYTQIKRTTSTNVITTPNQVLGVSAIVSTAAQFWRGNAAGLGGFFFFARFGIETLTAASPLTTRLFVGLHSGTTNILASDTVPAISAIGLWHDTTDGAGVINLLTKDGTTATKNALTGSPTTPYITGQGYDFYMFCKPADSTIYYRLDDLLLGTTLVDSSVTTTIPNNAVFMGPNVGMSNGASDLTAATVGIGVNRIYVESDH